MAYSGKKKSGAKAVGGEAPEIPKQESDAVKALLNRIERAKTLSKDHDERLVQLRRRVWGSSKESGEQDVRTNLIFATIATLLPHTYAKNPEIAVAPTEAVGKDAYKKMKDFSKTCQVMLNNVFVTEAKLKRRAKSAVRSAMTTAVGWLKMTFQESYAGDPIQVRRANDVQDNLAQIERLASEIKDEKQRIDVDAKREELKTALAAMLESNEVKIFRGITIDRIKTEDVKILDDGIFEFDDYSYANEIAHRVFMDDEEYKSRFGCDEIPEGAKEYPSAEDTLGVNGNQSLPSEQTRNYRAVWEVWSRRYNTITTVCEGVKGYCRAPYTPKHASERWYEFYALGFNLVEGRWRPLSDVELLIKLQDEYNETRYLYAETRKESIPARFFRKGGNLTPEDIEAITHRKPREMVGIEGNPSVSLSQDILQLDGIRIDPASFDVTLIRNDMDMLVGLSDASRANLIQAKTATEAEIMRQALMTRVAERQDATEDMIGDMARSALEIMLQRYSKEDVQQIAGEGAVWREDLNLDVQEIFQLVSVSVKAGSTGKPNLLKERESWAQIMPIINDTITQVMELRMNGQSDLANSKVELLRETLSRFDEKIDVDRFIPPEMLDEQGNPVANQNAVAQAAKLQEALTAQQEALASCQQELEQCKQALAKAELQEQAKVADANRKAEEERARGAEAEAKKAVDIARESSKLEQARIEAHAKTDEEAQKYRDKLESEERIAREKMANDMAISAVTALIGAMKPQPGKNADGTPAPSVGMDVEKAVALVQRFSGMSIKRVAPQGENESPDPVLVLAGQVADLARAVMTGMSAPKAVKITRQGKDIIAETLQAPRG